MPGMLDLSQLDASPMGLLSALFAMPGNAAQDLGNAGASLAQRMRQQSPAVPPAEDAGGGAAPSMDQPQFNARFDAGAGSFGSLAPDVPLPQPRPTAAPGPEGPADATLPANATPTVGGPVPAMAPAPAAAPPAPSLLDRVGSGLANNSNLLLALGAGFAGAPSIGTGMQRAFTNAGPIAQQNQTVAALVSKGMPEDMARLAAANPAALQQLLPRLLGVKQQTFTQVGEDMFGNKKYGFVDPVNGTITPYSGSTPFGGAGASGGTGGESVTGASINPNLIGDDYLKQFPQEVQAAVKDYIDGRSMPTGNPRAGFTQAVKMIAQKYGNDIGMPADDNSFNARRTMLNDLNKSTPGSAGGQKTFMDTSINHLAQVAQTAKDLDNSNGFGIAPLGHLINSTRGLTTEQAAKVQALSDAAQHYGQEVTKFYAGSPGGEAERDRFITALSGAKTPQELAAVLESEINLIPGRGNELSNRIEGTLGKDYLAKHPMMSPEAQASMAKVRTLIGQLRGQSPTAAAPAAPAPAPGRYVYDPATGTMKPAQ